MIALFSRVARRVKTVDAISLALFSMITCFSTSLAQHKAHTGISGRAPDTTNLVSYDNRTRFGVFGHAALTTHTADFPRIPGTQSCCLGFTGGSGTGFAAGGLIEVPLSQWLLLAGRASVLIQPFSMTTSEGTYIIVNGVGQNAAFEHRLTGSLLTAGVEPMLGIRLLDDLTIYAGARAGIAVSSSYEQKEQLTQPSGIGTFLNSDGTDSHKRTRNEFNGALPEPAFEIAPMLGIGYELPLNEQRTMLIAPEVFYQLGVSNVLADVNWKMSTLRAGVALKFAEKQKKPEIRRFEERIDTVQIPVVVVDRPFARGVEQRSEIVNDTTGVIDITEYMTRTDTLFIEAIRPKEKLLAAEVTAVGLEADGSEVPTVRQVTVEEFASTLMIPLLNYIFFDENSAAIPARYSSLQPHEIKTFDIARIKSPEKLQMYYHLLNIIGRRMTDNPKANLTLTGCNQDMRDEKDNRPLSRARAEAVKRYLVDVWKIEGRRILVEARNLPAKAAGTQTPDGAGENRRVEITSNDPDILNPVVTADTLRTANPPAIRFRTNTTADAGVGTWKLTVAQDGHTLKSFEGRDAVPDVLDWQISRSETIPRYSGNLTYSLVLTDNTGAEISDEKTIPVEQITISKKREERLGDKEIDRFSLILFDVRSSELTTAHTSVVDFIKKKIQPSSIVTITGFSDRLGSAAYNQQLAENRAAATAKALKADKASVSGKGQANLYDSALPEGRLYTRTVDVVIETPVKE